jgi:solute carrier family 6 GABA transporter-like protein 1
MSELDYGGFSLVFGTWPVVLGTLPGGEHWIRLLFFDLFLLGIDSAFAILEGPLTVMKDWSRLEKTRKWKLVLATTFVGWFLAWIYATDAGLIFLDTIDFYINFVLLLVGFFETFCCGWMFGIARSRLQVSVRNSLCLHVH